jgi:SpoVK/Ycf46/Vps4 family AAA+-type ATPase
MAQRSWEISAVNEFMVRLERFDGVFMATTNRFNSFDKAILRRLQMKVEFGYLTMEQVRDVLAECVVDKDLAHSLTKSQLDHLDYLTPGIVRAAVESLELRGFRPRTKKLLSALAKEQEEQTEGVVGRSIGFIQ